MCAILDASAVHRVFGDNSPEAGRRFLDWLDSGRGKLIVGGKLLRELSGTHAFQKWYARAQREGRAMRFSDREIDNETRVLEEAESCRSNDPHVIALARVSGARFLYSDDQDLQRDFKDSALIDNPRGVIYSTVRSGSFSPAHRRLLGRRNVCNM